MSSDNWGYNWLKIPIFLVVDIIRFGGYNMYINLQKDDRL